MGSNKQRGGLVLPGYPYIPNLTRQKKGTPMSDDLDRIGAVDDRYECGGLGCSAGSCPCDGPGMDVRQKRQKQDEQDKAEPVTRWAKRGNLYMPCADSTLQVPPAQYVVTEYARGQYGLRQTETRFDDLLVLKESISERLVQEIEHFWTRKDHFRRFGFVWKRGILLHGPPGSGKTTTLQLVSRQVVDAGGIALYGSSIHGIWSGLRMIRDIEPNRPVVVMMEDMETMIHDRGAESILLAILDGELQAENVLYVATTNFPGKLGKRITNRPSRFDLVIEVPMPVEKERDAYFRTKLERVGVSVPDAEIAAWVKGTEGMSYAHLKEVIVSTQVFEVSTADTIARLRGMMEGKLKADECEGPFKPVGQFV